MGNPKVILALFLTMIGCVAISAVSVAYMSAQKPAGQSAIAAEIKPSEPVQEPVPAIDPVAEQASNPTPDVCGGVQPTRTTSFSSVSTINVRATTDARIRTKPSTTDDRTVVGFLAAGQVITVQNSVHFIGAIPWLQISENRWIAANLVEPVQ